MIKNTLILFKIILVRKEKNNQYKLNVYNPITYLFILIAAPIYCLKKGCEDTKEQLKKMFTWV
tara:strand:- start:4449 stop:4637 length:189 start_codon:yes stop_codon:yes gene_type:complete